MKVSDTPLSVVPAINGRSPQVAEKKEVEDRVSVSTPQGEAAIRIARGAADGSRASRVEEIAAAVRRGQYYPSPQMLAQKLVSEAEVEGQLRKLLK